MNTIKVTPSNSNFYVFSPIYIPALDLFDCIRTQKKVIKHAGGTYSGVQKTLWGDINLYYDLFSRKDRKNIFYDTYYSVFGTHRGVKNSFQKVCHRFNHVFFHASIMLMRKKGIIPVEYSFLDYEKIQNQKNVHWQFGLQIHSLIYQDRYGNLVEITLNEVSGKEFSAYQARVFKLLDPDILSAEYIISGKDIIKKLADGSLDQFAYAHRAAVRHILK